MDQFTGLKIFIYLILVLAFLVGVLVGHGINNR